jgi:NAD-dependent SIR2 family protein deacetylase
MGLFFDPNVPDTAKWAFWATHTDNMRWGFEPNDGYSTLLDMVKNKDYFVLTSNVDACFERSGFEKTRIYTPQGEYTYLQCMTPCRHDAVFDARRLLDDLLPQVSKDGHIPDSMIPKCRHCGGEVFGNVRPTKR